eukprot:768104-Hanusia_phi.AAC.6
MRLMAAMAVLALGCVVAGIGGGERGGGETGAGASAGAGSCMARRLWQDGGSQRFTYSRRRVLLGGMYLGGRRGAGLQGQLLRLRGGNDVVEVQESGFRTPAMVDLGCQLRHIRDLSQESLSDEEKLKTAKHLKEFLSVHPEAVCSSLVEGMSDADLDQ